MLVSTSIWKEGANMYMPKIFHVAFSITSDTNFARDASEEVWVAFCQNEHENNLFERIGTNELLDEIIAATIEYCKKYSPAEKNLVIL